MRTLETLPVQLAAMHLDADRWCASHPAAASSSFLDRLTGNWHPSSTREQDFAAGLKALRGEQLRRALTEWLRQQVALVLRLDASRIPEDKALRSLGLDSLMALELRNRLERALSLKLSATLVWNYPTLSAMAAHLEGRIFAIPSGSPETKGKSVTVTESEPTHAGQTGQAGVGHKTAAELLEMELLGAQSLLQN
jgi:acyl carrier protein